MAKKTSPTDAVVQAMPANSFLGLAFNTIYSKVGDTSPKERKYRS